MDKPEPNGSTPTENDAPVPQAEPAAIASPEEAPAPAAPERVTISAATALLEEPAGAEPLAEATSPPSDTPLEPPPLDDAPPDDGERDALSPAVRRLVRQYEVDIRQVQGSGPDGRVRVGDVMAYLGGRTYVPPEPPEQAVLTARAPAPAEGEPAPARAEAAQPRAARADAAAERAPGARAEPQGASLAPITTVFECDLGSVLAHRKQLRQRSTDVVLTSYFLVAASEALRAVPEAAEGHEPVRFGAVLTFAENGVQSAMVDAPDGSAFESLHDRLLAVDKEFRFSARSTQPNPRLVDLLLHHHGASGSLVAAPTPIGDGHAASIGIGKLRREIVVGGGEEDLAPRIATRCYVSLSFHPERLELARANRFMAHLVRVLEQWPAA